MKRCEIKLLKKTCLVCKVRRARYRYRGRVRWNCQHRVCMRCWRAARDRMRSEVQAHYYIPQSVPVLDATIVPSVEGTVMFFNEVAKDHESLQEVQLVS
jgi:hypothetical protein